MTWKSMETPIDCGRVAVCNHVGLLTGDDPIILYEQTREFGQPKRWPLCDWWDSPSRGFWMVEKLSGQKAGVVPCDPLLVPSVVLLKLSTLYWHWVPVLSIGHQSFTWHDGRQVTNKTFQERFPGCQVIMAYALGGVVPLHWKWRVWGALTSWL